MFLSACFIIPYCCVRLVQFFFGVFVLICLFYLFGTGKLYIL